MRNSIASIGHSGVGQIKPPAYGPKVLVYFFIYQGNPFWAQPFLTHTHSILPKRAFGPSSFHSQHISRRLAEELHLHLGRVDRRRAPRGLCCLEAPNFQPEGNQPMGLPHDVKTQFQAKGSQFGLPTLPDMF